MKFSKLTKLAVTATYGVSPAMKTKTPGVGSGYLSSYRDKDGNWYDGEKNYRMVVPANVPMKQFWIKTNPGEYWFCYFRLYAPTQSFLDKSWALPDIEKVK